MSLLPFFEWLANTQGSMALHESMYLYPLIESVHVLTLCLFVGMSVMFDLRLLGISLRSIPVSDLSERLHPWLFRGFFVMLASGALLVYAIPVRSYQNIFFRVKMVFLVLAGLNAWFFHSGIYKTVGQWDRAARTPRRARRAGLVSLTLWASIIVFGRFIAYDWFDCEKPQPRWVEIATGCSYNGHPYEVQ